MKKHQAFSKYLVYLTDTNIVCDVLTFVKCQSDYFFLRSANYPQTEIVMPAQYINNIYYDCEFTYSFNLN